MGNNCKNICHLYHHWCHKKCEHKEKIRHVNIHQGHHGSFICAHHHHKSNKIENIGRDCVSSQENSVIQTFDKMQKQELVNLKEEPEELNNGTNHIKKEVDQNRTEDTLLSYNSDSSFCCDKLHLKLEFCGTSSDPEKNETTTEKNLDTSLVSENYYWDCNYLDLYSK